MIAPRHAKLAAYERELIGLVTTVKHWRPYLWGRTFIIRSNHYILKYILDQRLSTIPQHQWVSKLLGYDFSVEYKPDRHNIVADALSRKETAASLMSLSEIQFPIFNQLKEEVSTNEEAAKIVAAITKGLLSPSWKLQDDLILYKRRVHVPASSPILHDILHAIHDATHEGSEKTLHRFRLTFHTPKAKQTIQQFVSNCMICQRNKTEHLHPAGLLQPLSIPEQIWENISMDFIEALPKVGGKSVILTVVDRLSKYAHFIPLAHPYSTTTVAHTFFLEIVRLHGLPHSIVSDRDVVFTSRFWTELFRLSGVKLQMTSAYHPQSDGQSEAVNKIITMNLRCLTGDKPKDGIRWLPWAKFCYNTTYHQSIKTTPFKLVYGRDPPQLKLYSPGDAIIQSVDDLRDRFLEQTKLRLQQSQDY